MTRTRACVGQAGLRRAFRRGSGGGAQRVGVDDYSSESDVIIIPSALDFVSQDEMLTPLGRLDKYAASENIFNSTSGGVVCCTQSIQFGSSRRDNGQCQEGNRVTDGTNYQ